MTTISAPCPTCGAVALTADDITLMVCERAPALSYYAFWCPNCHDEVRQPADDYTISLLMTGRVQVNLWQVPAEALEHHHGPRLNSDDLLDLVLALGSGTDIAAVALAELTTK